MLAAGRSTRMGQDKALIAVDGMPLWQRQRDVLVAAGAGEIFLSVRPEQAWAGKAGGFSGILHDALPSAGPLCGLCAALERTACSHVAVVAVDMPHMKVEWFRALVATAKSGAGVVGRRGDLFEPLAAIYPVEAKWLAWEALAAGRYALQSFVGACVSAGLLHVREIQPGEVEWFTNWNEPSDVPPGGC